MMALTSKNIQVIDGARNCTYDIFSVSGEYFHLLFPDDNQDVEFSEDFFERCGEQAQSVWDRIWACRVDKKSAVGIHGTLFCGLQEKKQFYPTKRESEMVVSWARATMPGR